MDRHYSTLELAKHDETARAPERDYDATAFELDTSTLVPQTVPDVSPQVLYDSTLPEAHGNEKPLEEESGPKKLVHKWPWIVMALTITAATAIGLSVGLSNHREHSLYESPKVSSAPTPSYPNVTHTPQYILNDTSLAAISLSNGDRHLFFQDNNGLIRRAVHVESNGEWTASVILNFQFSPTPKRHTPLTAIGPYFLADMSLCYITEDNTVSLSNLAEGNWTQDRNFGNYSAAVGTRSLSMSLLPGANNKINSDYTQNGTIDLALLYLQDSDGKISSLLYRALNTMTAGDSLGSEWINVTSQESKTLPDEFRNAPGFNYSSAFDNLPELLVSHTLYETEPAALYSTPFFSAPLFDSYSVGAMFYSSSNLPLNVTSPATGDSFLTVAYETRLNSSGNFTQGESTPLSKDYTSIHLSDIAPFASQWCIWVNGTRPALLPMNSEDDTSLPDNNFPFTRLASVTSTDGSATYLYHQINGTTFAEEQWDDTSGAWVPTEYFTVSDS